MRGTLLTALVWDSQVIVIVSGSRRADPELLTIFGGPLTPAAWHPSWHQTQSSGRLWAMIMRAQLANMLVVAVGHR